MNSFVYACMLALLLLPVRHAVCVERSATPSSLERAKELLLSDKPAHALQALSSFAPSREEQSAYHYAYARALVGLKRFHDSIEHYRLAYVYADEAADQERLLLERADVYSAMGYYPEAAVAYGLFLRKYPKTGYAERAELGAAEALFRGNDVRRSLEHFDKAGASGRALIGKANALQAAGRTAEARALYRTLLEHEPRLVNSSSETLYWIGENFRQSGMLRDARVYFELVKDPALKFRAATGLGRIAMEEKNYEAAIMQFSLAADSWTRAVRQEAMLHRAEARFRLGKNAEARAALEELRLKHPYGPHADRAVLLISQILHKEGRFSESAALLKTLIYRRTPVPPALDQLEVMILDAKDRDPKAFVKLWSEAGRWMLDPSRSAALVAVAKALRHEGKAFLDVCAWLIKYGPDDAKAEGRLLLARFYADLGDAATAWSYFKRAKIRDRDDELARLRAAIYLANNDALNAAEALLTLREPGEADLLALLAHPDVLGRSGKAVEFCERIVRGGRQSAATLARFADALYAAGNRAKALEYYRAAVAGKAGDASADKEWAHYRIASLVGGGDGAEELRSIRTGKSVVGRYAAAELRGAELRGAAE